MKRNIITAIRMTVVTAILLGIVYPLVVTALAQVLFHDKANGQLIVQDGKRIGSRIIAQPFTESDLGGTSTVRVGLCHQRMPSAHCSWRSGNICVD
jgi:hypothetical protein